MKSILTLYDECRSAVEKNVPINRIIATGIFDKVIKMKYDIPNDKPELFRRLEVEIEQTVKKEIKLCTEEGR